MPLIPVCTRWLLDSEPLANTRYRAKELVSRCTSIWLAVAVLCVHRCCYADDGCCRFPFWSPTSLVQSPLSPSSTKPFLPHSRSLLALSSVRRCPLWALRWLWSNQVLQKQVVKNSSAVLRCWVMSCLCTKVSPCRLTSLKPIHTSCSASGLLLYYGFSFNLFRVTFPYFC